LGVPAHSIRNSPIIFVDHIMKNYIIPIIFLLVSYSGISSAGDYPHEEAGITVSIPDSWYIDIKDDDELIAVSPDEIIHLLFKIIEADDHQSEEKIADMLEEEISDIESDGSMTERDLQDGLFGEVYEGTGMMDGAEVNLATMIIENMGKKIILVGVMNSESDSPYSNDLEDILDGIKRY
jgi:predicted Zn-dependent protease